MQVHRHPRVRPRVGHQVLPDVAVERVRPRAAFEDVVAGATGEHVRPRAATEPVVVAVAVERVGAGAAGQGVGVVRAEDHLDVALEARQGAGIGQGVALGIAAGDHPGGEVHRHPCVRKEVVQPVRPGAAGERVRARTAIKGVVVVPADERVAVVAAKEIVVPGAAVQGIRARAAAQRVRAAEAGERVVPAQAGQGVGRGRAGQGVGVRGALQGRHFEFPRSFGTCSSTLRFAPAAVPGWLPGIRAESPGVCAAEKFS